MQDVKCHIVPKLLRKGAVHWAWCFEAEVTGPGGTRTVLKSAPFTLAKGDAVEENLETRALIDALVKELHRQGWDLWGRDGPRWSDYILRRHEP